MKLNFPFAVFKKTKGFLALDIGTEAVKALVFKKEGRKIIILGSSLEYFDRFGVFEGITFETDVMKKAISSVVLKAKKESGTKFDSFFLSLPADIFWSKTFSHQFKRETRSKISKTEEDQIYKKILEKTEKRILQTAQSNSGLLPRDVQLDLKMLNIKIDGYKVDRILNFEGQTLEFEILASFLPKHYLKGINEIFHNLDLKLLKISNLAENLHYLFESRKEQGIFIDIGGDVTQVFLVKEGRINQIFEFDIGGRFFSKSLSKRFGLTERLAREMKERYAKRNFSEESRKRIREILSPGVQKWFFNLKSRLREERFLLPSSIVLFGGGSLLPDIQTVLKRGSWTELPFIAKPGVRTIFPKDLANIDDRTHSLTSPQNIPAILICFFSSFK